MIKRFLEWALSLFGPSKKEQIDAWPFPVGHEPQLVVKKKPTVKKATTRTKKPAVAAKTARTKKAK
jgi:hypothetical protein